LGIFQVFQKNFFAEFLLCNQLINNFSQNYILFFTNECYTHEKGKYFRLSKDFFENTIFVDRQTKNRYNKAMVCCKLIHKCSYIFVKIHAVAEIDVFKRGNWG
jgi:hypothetical protein